MYQEVFNVCMDYEFNPRHHVDVVAKRLRAAAENRARRGRQYPEG